MQNEQFNELLKVIYAMRDSIEVHGAKIDALSKEMVSVKTEVGSLREDVTEIKGRVTHIEETMATKHELKAVETRLMSEIVPIKETVAYLAQQSATHDRDIYSLKRHVQP